MSNTPPEEPVVLSAEETARVRRQEILLDLMVERKLAAIDADYAATIAADRKVEDEDIQQQGYQQVGFPIVDDSENSAWTEYKQHVQEEIFEHGESAVSEIVTQEAVIETVNEEQPSRLLTPLSSQQINSIKSHMSRVKLQPPTWAVGLPEDVWANKILERAGLKINATPKDEKKAKSKSKTKSGKKKSKASFEIAPATNEDFEANFPAVEEGN